MDAEPKRAHFEIRKSEVHSNANEREKLSMQERRDNT